MTTVTVDNLADVDAATVAVRRSPGIWRQVLSNRRVLIGGGVLGAILLACVATILVTMGPVYDAAGKRVSDTRYTHTDATKSRAAPDRGFWGWMGYDTLGRSIMARALSGGTISLAVGFAAAAIAVVLGVSVGVLAGYKGGWVDAALMRSVDVLYGLPYVLLVVLFKVAFEPQLTQGVTWRVGFELVAFCLCFAGIFVALGRVGGWAKWAVAAALLVLTVDAVLNLSVWRETGIPVTGKSSYDAATALTAARQSWRWVALAAVVAGVALVAARAAAARVTLLVFLAVAGLALAMNVFAWRSTVYAPAAAKAASLTAVFPQAPAGAAGAAVGASALLAPGFAGTFPGVGVEAPRPLRLLVEPLDGQTASVVVLFLAIGLVSWLTMARVVRGQVLSLRGQPFIEACRAMGMKEGRIFAKHILPNLVGPITVYATLTVPSAMLQESFLSFLGVGINPPLPSWGNLASEAVELLYPRFYWWMLVFPCTLLAVTLLALNFVGDGLRDVFDPKKEAAKI